MESRLAVQEAGTFSARAHSRQVEIGDTHSIASIKSVVQAAEDSSRRSSVVSKDNREPSLLMKETTLGRRIMKMKADRPVSVGHCNLRYTLPN